MVLKFGLLLTNLTENLVLMEMVMVKMLLTPVKTPVNWRHHQVTAVDPELVLSTHDTAVAYP